MIIEVPWGWKTERHYNDRYMVITTHGNNQAVMATIDFRERGFRGGMVFSGRFENEAPFPGKRERVRYSGRGWEQRIVDDAVAWLRSVLGSTSNRRKTMGTQHVEPAQNDEQASTSRDQRHRADL